MASREAEALIQKYGGGWAADRANAEQIRQDAKAAGTWGVQQNSTLAFTPPKVVVPEEKKTSADKMWDRNSQTQKISETTRAKANYNTAKKQYDDYVNSAEYRQRLAENDQKARQQEVVNWFLPPEQRQAPKVIQDDREMYLRAAMEQAEAEYNRAEDAKVVASDLEAITGLSEEDRKELEQYAVNQIRDQNLPVEFQNMPFFKTAEQEAAGLIDKVGKQRADELAETYMRDQNAQFAEDVAAKGAENAGTGFWQGAGASAATIPINLVAGLVGSVGQLQGAARNTGRYNTLDPNATGTALQTYTGAVRGKVGQNISGDVYDEEGKLIKDGGAFRGVMALGYQGAMSIADSAARAALGRVIGTVALNATDYAGKGRLVAGMAGSALAAANSFSQTLSEASARGATPKQAITLATATSAIEALSEKIPLDELVNTAAIGKQSGKEIVSRALKQGGIELTTEEISFAASILAETAILKEKSSYKTAIVKKILDGESPEAAKLNTLREILQEAKETAIVSAISGFGSSTGSSVLGNMLADTTPNAGTPEEIKQQALEQVRNTEAQKAAPAQQTAAVAENATTDKTEAVAAQTTATEARPEQKPAAVSDIVADMVLENTTKQQAQEEARQPKQTEVAPQTDTRTDVQQRATERATKPAEVEHAGVNERTEPGIKGTVAAEQNFSGKAEYQNLLSEDNVQRDREGDVRPMEVPKTDSFGRRVSELVGNAYGAEITTDKMANTIEELVQEGALGFDVRHNQDSMNTAAEQIAQRGVAATRKQITNAVASGKIRDGDVEQAILLYAMYNSKDTPTAIDNASEILVDLAKMANITGRNLQMFRLLRKMTPEGQVSTIRKTVQSNIDSMIKSGAVKKGYTTEIDPELLAEYRKAAGENMRAVSEEQKKASAEKMKTIMDAIYAMEAAKMPSTMKAKWDAWRYMSMLGNAKTQVRNVAGNIAFTPYKTVKDKMGAAFEKMLPKEQRTKALVNDPELVRWADADAKSENVKDALKYSGKLGDDVAAEKMRDNMKVFDTKALEAVRKFVEKVPQAGDMAFKSKYYSHSLAGFLKARGYTVSDIQSGKVSDAILSEARSYAIQEAMKATFNDSNAFSDFMATGLRYKGDNPIGKALNTAAEGVLPFRRTPANIAVRFTEYSPVGMAKGVWDMATKVRKGEISAAAAVDQITAGMTGTAAMALGYFLANGIAGVKITGSGTGEDEKRQGHQDYALEWTDKDGQEYSYRIDWAAPANLPLFVGANINKLITDQGGDTSVSKFTSTLHGIMTMFEPMLALSCLSSLNDLVEGVRYADEGEALYTAAADVATSYIMQGIPSLVRQTAQAKQEFKQTTFANSDDPTLRDMQSTAANIPFVGEKYQTDKVNAWGEKESTGTEGERIFNAFINPGTLKKIDNSALEKEISRLNKSQEANVAPSYIPKVISYTDKDGNKHNNHRMTEEEYQTLAQTQGQTAKSILESMISSKNYAAMTDDQRAKAMQQVYSYAREKAMQKAFPDHLGYSESWMQELREGREAEYILRRVTNSELNRTMSNLTTAWDNKYSTGVTDSYSRELETAYDSYSKMTAAQKRQVKEFATGNAAKYIEARENGITHDDFISTAKNVNDVKGTGKNGTVRDIDRRQAIAKTTGLTMAEVDKLMRVYMPDYDMTDESPETTEFKYQYIREELDLSPAEYASTYRAYLDGEKKAGKIADIMKLGYDWKTANALYKVYNGSMKQKLIAMYG